jgi:YVTN family beta-propeller protein
LETINDEGEPHNVQVSPDGRVLGYTSAVMNKKQMSQNDAMGTNGSALFYDIDTGKLIKKIEVGKHPGHIVFTQDNKYVLVTNNQDNNVSVIDAETYKLINNISVGKGPHGFRISKDSKFAYVANMGEDTVSVVDIKNNKELRKITVGNTPITTAITSEGKTLIATMKVVATIETGKGSHGVVTSQDNKRVYVTNMYDNTVSVIDNTTNKVIATVKVSKTPNGISYK